MNGNIARNAVCLTHFIPERLDHLRFVKRLLETFCTSDICCAFIGTYAAYIAGVFISNYSTRLALGEFHIARTDSATLDSLYRKLHIFEIGPFEFPLTAWLEYESFLDYSIYEITYEVVSVPFHITIGDVSVYCGSQSSMNLAEFI